MFKDLKYGINRNVVWLLERMNKCFLSRSMAGICVLFLLWVLWGGFRSMSPPHPEGKWGHGYSEGT